MTFLKIKVIGTFIFLSLNPDSDQLSQCGTGSSNTGEWGPATPYPVIKEQLGEMEHS